MIGYKECHASIKKRYKSLHEQSKKHENFSNLILNNYVVK